MLGGFIYTRYPVTYWIYVRCLRVHLLACTYCFHSYSIHIYWNTWTYSDNNTWLKITKNHNVGTKWAGCHRIIVKTVMLMNLHWTNVIIYLERTHLRTSNRSSHTHVWRFVTSVSLDDANQMSHSPSDVYNKCILVMQHGFNFRVQMAWHLSRR